METDSGLFQAAFIRGINNSVVVWIDYYFYSQIEEAFTCTNQRVYHSFYIIFVINIIWKS